MDSNQDTPKNYPIRLSEAAQQIGAKTSTVRSICSRGLIPHLKRNARGQWVLNEQQVQLLRTICMMKQADFAPKEIRQFSRLYRQGDSTTKERLAMLATKKRQLWQEIVTRQQVIDFIERQEEVFGQNPSKM